MTLDEKIDQLIAEIKETIAELRERERKIYLDSQMQQTLPEEKEKKDAGSG